MIGRLMALVVVLTVLCLGSLLLTLAVVRRLRVHEEMIAAIAFPGPGLEPLAGRRQPDSHRQRRRIGISGAAVAGERLVGLFSAGCWACVEQAREFKRHPDPDRVAVVVLGEGRRGHGLGRCWPGWMGCRRSFPSRRAAGSPTSSK